MQDGLWLFNSGFDGLGEQSIRITCTQARMRIYLRTHLPSRTPAAHIGSAVAVDENGLHDGSL